MTRYFISDTHFDHKNIIKYCDRPFSCIEQMNDYILDNWNSVVGDNDDIFFLGDMAFGRDSRKPSWWINKLKGNINYIKGSHDKGINAPRSMFIDINGINVLLIHSPWNIHGFPPDYDGWAIHGHVHNNQPFLWLDKRINVSVEAVGYMPISEDVIKEVITYD